MRADRRLGFASYSICQNERTNLAQPTSLRNAAFAMSGLVLARGSSALVISTGAALGSRTLPVPSLKSTIALVAAFEDWSTSRQKGTRRSGPRSNASTTPRLHDGCFGPTAHMQDSALSGGATLHLRGADKKELSQLVSRYGTGTATAGALLPNWIFRCAASRSANATIVKVGFAWLEVGNTAALEM